MIVIITVNITCTLASLKSSRNANSSRVNTSGYCDFSNARSNWCSWYVVNVVLDLLRVLNKNEKIDGNIDKKTRMQINWNATTISCIMRLPSYFSWSIHIIWILISAIGITHNWHIIIIFNINAIVCIRCGTIIFQQIFWFCNKSKSY